jgi:hypothetical protein
VSALRGEPVAVVCACGGLWVTRSLAPRGVQDEPRGRRNEGTSPAPRAQPGSPRARGAGAEHESVALVVPGSVGLKAACALSSLRASALAGPGSSIESPGAAGAKRRLEAPGG